MNQEIGHSMYCTPQADIMMTEESTTHELSKAYFYTPYALVYFLENLSSLLVPFVESSAY